MLDALCVLDRESVLNAGCIVCWIERQYVECRIHSVC